MIRAAAHRAPSGLHCFVFGSATLGGHEMMATRIVAEVATATGRARVLAAPAQIERLKGELPATVEVRPLEHTEGRFESVRGYFNPRVYSAARELWHKTEGCATVVMVNGGLPANHSLTLGLALARRLREFRLIVYYPMVHSIEELGLPAFRGLSYRIARDRVIRLADGFVTIDEIWRCRLSKTAKRPVDVAIVHNFVDRSRLVPSLRTAVAKRYRVCMVGRHDQFQKGLDLFTNVAAHLAAEPATPPIEFGIVGSGPDGDELRRCCAEIANDRVSFEFHGWQPQPEALVSSHDALVLPSRLEGVPTVVVEALMMGLRVFAFDIPGATSLLPADALVPAFDTAEMAKRIAHQAMLREPAPPPGAYVEMLGDRQRFAIEVRQALCS